MYLLSAVLYRSTLITLSVRQAERRRASGEGLVMPVHVQQDYSPNANRVRAVYAIKNLVN